MTHDKHIRPPKGAPVFLALAVALQAQPAHAGLLGLQIQTQYDFSQVKRRGLSATGRGRITTNYGLTLRRPFLPSSTLMSDMSYNSTQNGDTYTRQNTRGWTVNLYANQPKYMLSGRMSRSDYDTSSDLISSTTGYIRDYNAGLFLRQPAYPALNLQFQRNIAGSQYGDFTSGGYSTTNWLMSGSYDMEPFRFSVDRIRRVFGYSGASGIQMNSQTSAVTMNHALLPGLLLTGELSRAVTDVNYATTSTATNTTRRLIRLSATPLRSTVADIALTSLTNSQSLALGKGNSTDKSLSWNVRSEILPGLSLDYGDQKQSLNGSAFLGTQGNTSRNRNLSVAARVAEGTILNVTSTRSNYDVDSVDYHALQNAFQTALQTSPTRTTDLSLSYGRNKFSTAAGDAYNNTYQGISIRDRTSTRLSVGATLRHNNVSSAVASGPGYSQKGNSADLDLLWQPNYDVGLNLRLSYQKNNGLGAFRTLAPSANLRWQLDRATSLTANYSVQSFQQFDPASILLFGQDTRGLSVRVTHSFKNDANLDIAYDFQSTSLADLQWRRQLRVTFTMVP